LRRKAFVIVYDELGVPNIQVADNSIRLNSDDSVTFTRTDQPDIKATVDKDEMVELWRKGDIFLR